jgi:hypothetical protein
MGEEITDLDAGATVALEICEWASRLEYRILELSNLLALRERGRKQLAVERFELRLPIESFELRGPASHAKINHAFGSNGQMGFP